MLPLDRSSGSAPLRTWERWGLVVAAIALAAFGVLVEVRSAYQSTSKTDFGVYARASWAVRTGNDLYRVTDNNGWHYCYPPPFAILLTPLADPLPGVNRHGYLPFSVSVAIWFLLSVGCVFWAVHRFASAVMPDARTGSRLWWSNRLMPLLICIGGVGFTLGRGQVNLLLVALIAGMFGASVTGRRTISGIWLACAIALKVIPGLLVLYPFVKWDRRMFVGLGIGLVVLFGLIPATIWGVDGAVELNRKMIDQVLKPGATGDGDQTRARELTNATATDSQSFQAAIHANLHPNRATRPVAASAETRLAHWLIGAVLISITVAVVRKQKLDRPADSLIFLGCLCILMMMLSPVSHMHYYAMALPALVAGLWLRSQQRRPGVLGADTGTTIALVMWGAMTALPLFPGPLFDRLREVGFGTVASVGLWAFGIATLVRSRVAVEVRAKVEEKTDERLAA